jgi:hypothetical protein
MTLAPKPNAAAVRAYRDQHECSLQEAKSATIKQWRVEQLQALRQCCDRYMTLAPAITIIVADLIELLQETDT